MNWPLESAAVGLVALLFYLRTLCRTVYVGDSGELIAAVYTLGIPHPPGYPLYVLLGKAFSVVVAIGNPAIRINLFSSFCAAAASAIFFLSLRFDGLSGGAASATALSIAFGASMWSQATIARVYTPAACAISLTFYFVTRWNLNPQQIGWLAAAIAIAGTGIALHPMVVVMLPATIVAAAFRRPSLFTDFRSLWLIGWILPGLALYLWVPLRALSKPRVRWGNLRTRDELIRYFFRGAYWKFRYVSTPRKAAEVIAFYCRRVSKEYGILGAVAIAVGIPIIARASPAFLAMVIVTAGGNAAAMIVHARREDIFYWPRYMMAAWLALAFPLGAGWWWIIGNLPAAVRTPALFALPIVLVLRGFRHRDLSRHRYAGDYSRRILRDLPADSILIARDDNVLFPLMYLMYVEEIRRDVKLIDQAARDDGSMRFNPRRDSVYCTHWEAAFVMPAIDGAPGLRLVPEGLFYRVVSTDMDYVARNLWRDSEPVEMEDQNIPRDYLTRRLLANVCIMRAEWESLDNKSACKTWCIKAAGIAWDCDAIQHNVGVILEREGFTEVAKDFFAKAVKIRRNEGFRSDETG